MKVTMLLADAAGVADGKLDILGGDLNMTGRRACHEERLAQPRVPWEGIAAKRRGVA